MTRSSDADSPSVEIRQRARQLRKELTPAEQLLWTQLRNRRLAGLKFRRQHPIGRFIVDFYCPAHKLVVEIDGPVHEFQEDQDLARADYLQQRGYRVVRFRNEHVLEDLPRVLQSIQEACLDQLPRSSDTRTDEEDGI
jgi:very-short-patch-repair endonuclease